MKIRELKEVLQDLDEDQEVYVHAGDGAHVSTSAYISTLTNDEFDVHGTPVLLIKAEPYGYREFHAINGFSCKLRPFGLKYEVAIYDNNNVLQTTVWDTFLEADLEMDRTIAKGKLPYVRVENES